MTISVPIISRNVVKLKYPLDLVVESVCGLADEIVLSVDPTSDDDSLDFCYDIMLDINSRREKTRVKYVESVWDLDNVSSTGEEFSRQTNIAIGECSGDWILSLQADESIHEDDFSKIERLVQNTDIDAYSMTRLYFYGDMDTIRDDWTVPIIRLFRRGTRFSCGDAMNTEGSGKVVHCGVPIYHYSRIGDAELISKRIRTLDGFFHPAENLLSEKELKPYDFETHNFDCMSKVDVGKEKVMAEFSLFTGTHPAPFRGYNGL